jgi:hypothetical protein
MQLILKTKPLKTPECCKREPFDYYGMNDIAILDGGFGKWQFCRQIHQAGKPHNA